MLDGIEQGSDALDPASDEQTLADADVQATGADEQAEGTLSESSGIRVGKQVFKDHNELAKAYGEAQKKITEMGQSNADEKRAWGWMLDWMKKTKSADPERWSAFQDVIGGKPLTPKNVASAIRETNEPVRQAPQEDGKFSDLEVRLARTEAEIESANFLRSHPDLSAKEYTRVVQRVIQWENEGKPGRSLEDGYRDLFFDEFANKVRTQGQKQAEAASKKGANATALGVSAAGARPPQPKDKTSWWKMTENQKNEHLFNKMKAQGINFNEEE